MGELVLGPFTVQADVNATRAAYVNSPAVDPLCCNACATFLLAASSGALPSKVATILQQLGADAAKPVEAWGAPDGGFLQVWWPFIGTVVSSDPNNEQSVPIGEGQTLRFTSDYPAPSWVPTPGHEVPALEFTWVGGPVRDLERRAWTAANR